MTILERASSHPTSIPAILKRLRLVLGLERSWAFALSPKMTQMMALDDTLIQSLLLGFNKARRQGKSKRSTCRGHENDEKVCRCSFSISGKPYRRA